MKGKAATKKPLMLTHVKDLTSDPQNARKHGPRNVGTIVSALQEVGAARSIVIDEHGVILAGNATVDAAGEAGITKLRVVDVDGQTIVAVRRTGLTAVQKARLALFDNRAAELAEGWDPEVLAALQGQGVSLDGLWYENELPAVLGLPSTETEARASLAERFGVPPFSVLDARQGYWQDRKRAWLALGIESELGRGENLQGLSESNDEYRNNKNEYLARIGRGPLATGKPLIPNGGGHDLQEPLRRQAKPSQAKPSQAHRERAASFKNQDKLTAFQRRKGGGASPGGSPRPAMTLKDGKTQRGDGRGRPLPPAAR